MGVPEPVFTVAEIAATLGVSRRAISLHVDPALADGAKVVRGQTAAAFQVNTLPAPLLNRIEQAAKAQGFEDAHRFLEVGPKPWAPSVPVGRMPAGAIDTAKKRAHALALLISDRGERALDEIAAEGAERFKAYGDGAVAVRTVRRWIDRAIERDRGFEDWARWEIYLDDGLRPVTACAPERVDSEIAPRLIEAIEDLADAAHPTRPEIETIWMRAMDDADALTRCGESEKRARVLIAGVLWRTGARIAETREALQKQVQRKRAAWLFTGGSLAAVSDGRVDANRGRRWELPEDDYRVILRHALEFESLATGYRYARKKRLLSKETMERFTAPNADKSYVPHSIARQVMGELQRLLPLKIGPHAARMAGPYVDRDYSGMEPGDWWQSDDMTGVYQFWDERPDGSVYVGQGQFLPMMDLRSLCILGFTLIPAKGYTAAAIRRLIVQCHDVHGLPRHGFYFERGLWERARLLKGRASDSGIPMAEMERGLREFGLHFEHARNPRAKVIERILGILQVKMQRLPGYSGRDARKDMPEAIRDQVAAVRAGRVHPSKFFLSTQELTERIQGICEDYNAEKHSNRARIIPGRSPNEVYQLRKTDDIQHLPEGFRHLLASHRFPMKIGRNGILVAKSFGGGRYVSPELLTRKGETVLVWLDVEDLSQITVTTLTHECPLVVPRQDPIPAMGAAPEEIRRVMNLQRAAVARGQAVVRVLAGGAVPFRKLAVDPEMERKAAEFRRVQEEHRERQEHEARQQKEIEKMRREIAGRDMTAELDALEAKLVAKGLLLGLPHVDLDRQQRGLELMKNAIERENDAP